MKCFVMTKPGETGWIEKDIPSIEPEDVLLAPVAVAMCTSDIHTVKLGLAGKDLALGHECLGKVVNVGEKVNNFQVGDIVIVPSTCPRWDTLEAQAGLHQHSEGMFGGVRFSTKQDGCFSQYFVGIQADMNLYKVPPGIDYKSALMLCDMASTGMQGVQMADLKFGQSVVVLGIGPVGLMAVASARRSGAGKIFAVGSRPKCTALALEFGANQIINYKDGDIVEAVLQATNNQGVDRVIIAGGNEDALSQGFGMLKTGGVVSNVNYFECPTLNIDALSFGLGMAQKTLTGGLCAGGAVNLHQLCEFVKYNNLPLNKLVTHEFFGLEDIEIAYQLMESRDREVIKPIVIIDQEAINQLSNHNI